MSGGSIQQGETVHQHVRLYESRTDPQIPNHEEAYVNRLDDMKRLQRFLIIGSDRTYYTREKELEKQNADCVTRLIRNGKGKVVVNTIKEISISRRNVRQNSLLLAYAICARSNDRQTKSSAYALLSEICRIPTHLFLFIKYCEDLGNPEGTETGTGWGRAHKRAISSWYTKFEQDPETLARLITKYKSRYDWEHKDVLRLSHPCTDDPIMGFIFRYITKGFDSAIEKYRQAISEIDDEDYAAKFHEIKQKIEVYDQASKCEQVPNLCSMIHEHKLVWEHCNRKLLTQREVWGALLHHMPVEALIRNLGKMTSYGLFADNSEDEQKALDKINTVNSARHMSGQEPVERQVEDTDSLDDERPWVSRNTCKNFIHPITIFIAWMTYKEGHGVKGNITWQQNERIANALEEAFYRGYQAIEPTGKKFYLAVSASPSMSHKLENSNVTCTFAAAAMIMLTARTEENCIIKACGERMRDIGIMSTDKLEQVEQKVRIAQNDQHTDCAEPIKDAIEMNMKDIDVFVIYTDSETCGGNVHPYQALLQYREYAANPDVKMVVCGMCATDLTIADKEDSKMLDLVGFDSNTPWIISEFARGRL